MGLVAASTPNMIPALVVGAVVAVGTLAPLANAAPQSSGAYNGVIKSPFQGAGSYGLAFVAPASYGYSTDGPYSKGVPAGPANSNYVIAAPVNSNYGASFGFEGTAATLGPGKYAFPIFDHNQGYGGFGALGYYGTNLGFAYPGYGYGNGIFGARSYANPHV